LGAIADSRASAPLPPKVGEFVLIRGGARLFARPEDSSPRVTLPSRTAPFIAPIAAKAVSLREGYVEVEMTSHAARVHCGDYQRYSDHLRGFVRVADLSDVTVRATRIPVPETDDHLDVLPGLAVDQSGPISTLEFMGERLTVPIPSGVIGRSYRTPPRREAQECMDSRLVSYLVEFGDGELVSADAPTAGDDDGLSRRSAPPVDLVVHFASGELLGEAPLPRERNFGQPDPSDAKRRCTSFAVISGVASDATVCFDADAFDKETRPQPLAHIDMGMHRVKGRLGADIVRRIVHAHVNEIRHCYARELKHDTTLAGGLTVSFVIEADGKVRQAQVESAMPGGDGLGECLKKAFRRWTFPKPTDGKVVRVSFPFVFWSTPPTD